MSALLVVLAGLALAGAAAVWSSRSVDGASRVAIVAVLGVTAASFNVVVPVWSIEATTTVVLCTALALGSRTGVATGLVAVVGSSVAGGIGVWTVWQVVAVVAVSLVGAALARTGRDADWFERRRMALLGAGAALAALSWDVITTAGSVLSLAHGGAASPLAQLAAFLLLGAAFTITHVAFSAAFTMIGGPPLLHALARARNRLDGGRVTG